MAGLTWSPDSLFIIVRGKWQLKTVYINRIMVDHSCINELIDVLSQCVGCVGGDGIGMIYR